MRYIHKKPVLGYCIIIMCSQYNPVYYEYWKMAITGFCADTCVVI